MRHGGFQEERRLRPFWRLMGWLVFALGAAVAAAADPPTPPFNGFAAKDMVLPLYTGSESTPRATVRVGSIRQEFQRRGFFRIGLLPMMVAEQVRVELRSGEELTNTLAVLNRFVAGNNAGPVVELRQVFCETAAAVPASFSAGCLRATRTGEWELRSPVRIRAGDYYTEVPRACLRTPPGKPARLVWKGPQGETQLDLATWTLLPPGQFKATSPKKEP